MTDLRERLAASVGGKANLASMFAARTMRNLDARAEREIEDAAAMIDEALLNVAQQIETAGLSQFHDFPGQAEELTANLVAKWAAYQHAGSRTANWMVTGPARFPVDRNRKRMDTEHRRWVELYGACKVAPRIAVKRAQLAQRRSIGTAGIVDLELQDLKARLDARQARQLKMKAVNEQIRRHDLKQGDHAMLVALMRERGFEMSVAECLAVLTPNYMGAVGFERFQMSNNLAEIKRLEQRVAQVTAKAARVEAAEAPERVVNGVRVVEDNADDRLRLIFDGKPAPAIIATLKSRGFRWSPRAGAWQRQLTQNARYAAEAVLKAVAA